MLRVAKCLFPVFSFLLFLVFESPVAHACDKAPEITRLEQVSQAGIRKIRLSWKDGCGDEASAFILRTNYRSGTMTDLASGASSIDVDVSMIDGRQIYQLQLCYPDLKCSPVSSPEEIFVLRPRAPLVKNLGVSWKVPVVGVDLPNINRFRDPKDPAWCSSQSRLTQSRRSPDYGAYCSRNGIVTERCKTLSSRNCWAIANDGTFRVVHVPSEADLPDGKINARYTLYTQQKQYLKELVGAYLNGIKLSNGTELDPKLSDPKWFRYALEGFIKSSEVKAKADGSLFLTVPFFSGFYTSSVDLGMWLNDFAHLLRSSMMASAGSSLSNIRKLRWTIYSVLKSVVSAYEVRYQEGGLLVTEPGRENYFLSFPGETYSVSNGKYVKGDALVSLGKFMATMEDMDGIQEYLRELSRSNLGLKDINDGLAKRIDGLIKRGVTRLGGRSIKYSITIHDFYNSSIGYGDYSWNLTKNRRQGISFKTNFTKACGGYGGYWQGDRNNRVSSTDIGQLRNMHFLLFGYVASDSPDFVVDRARFEDAFRNGTGYAKRFFPNPLSREIQEIGSNFFKWIDGCCRRYETDVTGETPPPYCR